MLFFLGNQFLKLIYKVQCLLQSSYMKYVCFFFNHLKKEYNFSVVY